MPFGPRHYVMIIDDDVDIRESLVLYVQHERHLALGVPTALDALKLLSKPEKHLPDIIFLDQNMPYLKGTEFIRIVRLMPKLKDIPIILCTSTCNDADLPDDVPCLRKPFDMKDFVNYIHKFAIVNPDNGNR